MSWNFGFYQSTDNGLHCTAWKMPKDLPTDRETKILSVVGTATDNYGKRFITTGFYDGKSWHTVQNVQIEAWQDGPRPFRRAE